MEPSDLRTFTETVPDWDDIEAKVKQILHQYVAGHDFQDLRIQPDNEHDWKRENQLLFNWDSLMYALLALATLWSYQSYARPTVALGANVSGMWQA